MVVIRHVLARLLKVFLVGFYLLLGTSLTLAGFGLIPEWGGFAGDGFLHDLWVKPWSIFAAMTWFGIGVLFFEERPEKKPLLSAYVHKRYIRATGAINTLMDQGDTDRAVRLLNDTLEDLADQLGLEDEA